MNGFWFLLFCFYFFNLHSHLYSGFDKDPATSKFEIHARVNQLSLIGHYNIDGRIIIIPVVGNGAANLTFGSVIWIILFDVFLVNLLLNLFLFIKYRFSYVWTDKVDFNVKLTPKVEVKNNKQYLKFSDVKLDFQTTRWVFDIYVFNLKQFVENVILS